MTSREGRRRLDLPGADRAVSSPVLDIDALIDDPETHIVVCCGSGGVGKTTTAAALGVRAAEKGRHVAVLTIDPARRLAQSMGLTKLDNSPRPVTDIDSSAGGSLDAMMLDMKRTFDEVVEAHASPEKAAAILANPFYVSLSSSFAGTQEYMAMEKLGQLRHERNADGTPRWDLIVVDTPPSRSALDFLDAPQRLGSFLDGRFVRVLTAPARIGGRAYLKVISAGVGIATSALSKVLGAQLLTDLQALVSALDTTFGGFREHSEQTYALLKARGTAFVIVAIPDTDAMREAGYFVERLSSENMPLAGVVINRVERALVPRIGSGAAASALEQAALAEATGEPDGDGDLGTTVSLLRLQKAIAGVAERHGQLVSGFAQRLGDVALRIVPAEETDIHDLDGLRHMGSLLSLE